MSLFSLSSLSNIMQREPLPSSDNSSNESERIKWYWQPYILLQSRCCILIHLLVMAMRDKFTECHPFFFSKTIHLRSVACALAGIVLLITNFLVFFNSKSYTKHKPLKMCLPQFISNHNESVIRIYYGGGNDLDPTSFGHEYVLLIVGIPFVILTTITLVWLAKMKEIILSQVFLKEPSKWLKTLMFGISVSISLLPNIFKSLDSTSCIIAWGVNFYVFFLLVSFQLKDDMGIYGTIVASTFSIFLYVIGCFPNSFIEWGGVFLAFILFLICYYYVISLSPTESIDVLVLREPSASHVPNTNMDSSNSNISEIELVEVQQQSVPGSRFILKEM